MDRLEARIGPLKDTALERLYLASYEANADAIWTPGFEEAFANENGYRLEPFLPALFGVIVKDRETTERFLYDYRRTVSELFVNNLYREASRLCRERGLLLCSEAGRPGWTYQAGTHMNTHLTWWELSGQLHAYLARFA